MTGSHTETTSLSSAQFDLDKVYLANTPFHHKTAYRTNLTGGADFMIYTGDSFWYEDDAGNLHAETLSHAAKTMLACMLQDKLILAVQSNFSEESGVDQERSAGGAKRVGTEEQGTENDWCDRLADLLEEAYETVLEEVKGLEGPALLGRLEEVENQMNHQESEGEAPRIRWSKSIDPVQTHRQTRFSILPDGSELLLRRSTSLLVEDGDRSDGEEKEDEGRESYGLVWKRGVERYFMRGEERYFIRFQNWEEDD
jgi:hypothetical protein